MLLTCNSITTPAFIYDENEIEKKLTKLRKINECQILYPLKPFAFAGVLRLMAPLINGFSVSSLFEAMLAKEASGANNIIHITTPGLRPDEVGQISELCDYISFNSLTQWKANYTKCGSKIKQGLRINPQLSFIDDDRYNPCRKHSKLGVPLSEVAHEINDSSFINSISGFLFHTNCESTDFNDLMETVKHIETHLPGIFEKIHWINLGGGYLFDESDNIEVFTETVFNLKRKYGLDVFFEPGRGIIGDAGYIVSTVIDLFNSDNRKIAILDTTVNHMPEVFEYQYKPDIIGESLNGKYKYIMAGASCLAGDVFGEYKFRKPLKIGDKVVFQGMGAYTLVKSNMFNGINLPSIYAYTKEGKLVLKKNFSYDDFLSRYEVNNNALERKKVCDPYNRKS